MPEPFWTPCLHFLEMFRLLTRWRENTRGQQCVSKSLSDAWHADGYVIDEEELAKYTLRTLNLSPDPHVGEQDARTQWIRRQKNFQVSLLLNTKFISTACQSSTSTQKYKHQKNMIQLLKCCTFITGFITYVWDSKIYNTIQWYIKWI